MSLERLGEIHNEKDESPPAPEGGVFDDLTPPSGAGGLRALMLQNVFFRYGDPSSDYILQNLNLTIPEGKTTAIVGESGSGKTTLIKLLLKFYAPEKGTILVGNTPLETINSSHWRKK
jgi:ATP-binding cassette subfamily B protein